MDKVTAQGHSAISNQRGSCIPECGLGAAFMLAGEGRNGKRGGCVPTGEAIEGRAIRAALPAEELERLRDPHRCHERIGTLKWFFRGKEPSRQKKEVALVGEELRPRGVEKSGLSTRRQTQHHTQNEREEGTHKCQYAADCQTTQKAV